MLRLLKTINLFLLPVILTAQHPVTFFTKAEAAEVKRDIPRYPLLTRSYNEIKSEVDIWIGKDVDVPFPKDPAGGYTHDKHKANYMLMFNSAILYNLTGDSKYATLVKQLFLKYAKLNPILKNHPEATSSSPGRIFWQALNDANWLVYTGMAYDLIYNSLSVAERKTIEDGAFKPEVDFITKDLKNWFNLIHNHGVWACAGVGIVGIATNNKEYVEMALYGTDKNGKSGFIAQMDGLFSPDGYYTEGPYYVRYAILPYYLFANALKNAKPELRIFEHRDKILKKALLSGLQQTNLDGTFFPLNDAIKEKDYTSNELITAVDIAWNVYGKDNGLLVVAKKQDRVLLNNGGVSLAASIVSDKKIPDYYPYQAVEYADGVKGDEGGVSVLRNGKGKDLTTLIYKYTSHGLSHGHFDKLNINLYDKGNEILTDYGSVRFVGVEQKYGGRYLPENKAYASQTIAHNTLVLDETSHFNGKEDEAEKHHSEKLFSDLSNSNAQVVGARENNAYKNANLQRTIYMLQLPDGKKIMVDVFNVISSQQAQFDLPFQYSGQLISTSFKYSYSEKAQETLGKKNGYQFLWKEGEASVKDTIVQFTFLNNRTYYSISSLIESTASLFFTRTGANDPNFNLRREPAFIIRKNGLDQSFISVIEVHGKFDPVLEFSTNSYSSVQNIKLLENDDYSIIEVIINGKKLLIAQSNKDFDKTTTHVAKEISWTGPYTILYDGKNLK
ncbi:MAG TPA: heparinase II/III family protein [Chitinophagaceae bacterium]|nr:heparinase II/III family protein [Chitinophagaceae bacterium]